MHDKPKRILSFGRFVFLSKCDRIVRKRAKRTMTKVTLIVFLGNIFVALPGRNNDAK